MLWINIKLLTAFLFLVLLLGIFGILAGCSTYTASVPDEIHQKIESHTGVITKVVPIRIENRNLTRVIYANGFMLDLLVSKAPEDWYLNAVSKLSYIKIIDSISETGEVLSFNSISKAEIKETF